MVTRCHLLSLCVCSGRYLLRMCNTPVTLPHTPPVISPSFLLLGVGALSLQRRRSAAALSLLHRRAFASIRRRAVAPTSRCYVAFSIQDLELLPTFQDPGVSWIMTYFLAGSCTSPGFGIKPKFTRTQENAYLKYAISWAKVKNIFYFTMLKT